MDIFPLHDKTFPYAVLASFIMLRIISDISPLVVNFWSQPCDLT